MHGRSWGVGLCPERNIAGRNSGVQFSARIWAVLVEYDCDPEGLPGPVTGL